MVSIPIGGISYGDVVVSLERLYPNGIRMESAKLEGTLRKFFKEYA